MSETSSYVLALEAIAYAQISSEGYKVANAEREREGKAPAYDESAFFTLAENMRGQVREAANWIGRT